MHNIVTSVHLLLLNPSWCVPSCYPWNYRQSWCRKVLYHLGCLCDTVPAQGDISTVLTCKLQGHFKLITQNNLCENLDSEFLFSGDKPQYRGGHICGARLS